MPIRLSLLTNAQRVQDYDQWVLTFIRDVAVAREKIPDRYRLWTIMQITSMNRTAEPKSLFKKICMAHSDSSCTCTDPGDLHIR